ncbi:MULTISPECIES: hypothetical protein [Nocardia]|uniref:hypothetical protein n=1 Tax=Nocardia TaxID=1817 RepID=UPI000A7EBD8C|nr:MULTISPECIES: hypothetical protein [Nocardia]MBF6278298.1 hypothetical protein [Nocardia nova]
MTLVERATGSNVFWKERSVRRKSSDELEDIPNAFSISMSVSGGKSSKDAPVVDTTVEVSVSNPSLELKYVVTYRFYFANDSEPPPEEEVDTFMREHGIGYALGVVNGALVSDTTAFRVKPLSIPINAYDEVRKLIPQRPSDQGRHL